MQSLFVGRGKIPKLTPFNPFLRHFPPRYLHRPPICANPRLAYPAGEGSAAILRAEGYALALEKIFAVARTLDANTISLQYLEPLKTLGASPSTKFIFPMEFASYLRPLAGFAQQASGGKVG